MSYSYKTLVNGLTGEVRFDNHGYRSNFAVDVIELTSSGIAKVGTWNSSSRSRLKITEQRKKEIEDTEVDSDSMRNKTYIVVTALVYTKP